MSTSPRERRLAASICARDLGGGLLALDGRGEDDDAQAGVAPREHVEDVADRGARSAR